MPIRAWIVHENHGTRTMSRTRQDAERINVYREAGQRLNSLNCSAKLVLLPVRPRYVERSQMLEETLKVGPINVVALHIGLVNKQKRNSTMSWISDKAPDEKSIIKVLR